MRSENNTRFEVSYSTWQEANTRCKGYDNFNDYYQYSPRDIDIARMTWVADNLSIKALIFAIYMGFKEIYLLSMDHDYICNNENNYRFYKN